MSLVALMIRRKRLLYIILLSAIEKLGCWKIVLFYCSCYSSFSSVRFNTLAAGKVHTNLAESRDANTLVYPKGD